MKDWANELPVAVTVSDKDGIIIYMNEKSKSTFADDGGGKLIGKSMFACHSKASQEKIQHMVDSRSSNIYTIKKKNKKKMIIQLPWFDSGNFEGLVEFSIELPNEIPHFDRD
jgi:transcriptional regulator with PAS, ATPase and Fis domain